MEKENDFNDLCKKGQQFEIADVEKKVEKDGNDMSEEKFDPKGARSYFEKLKGTFKDKKQIVLRSVLSAGIVLISIAAYFAFGFFFDVFLECIPLLFIPLVTLPFVWLSKKILGKVLAIVLTCVFTLLSIGAAVGVGVVATSKPAYGIKPECGTVLSYTYSKDFMESNYDINQKTVIDVWLPENYSSYKKYPVLYVLDGDMLFNYAAVKAAQSCARGEGDVIVVGIGYGYWNSTFARGGIVWQDTEHLRGRWRDFTFADDTEPGYMPGTIMGGSTKRGKEYTDFIVNTVVKDIREKYSTDDTNSTIFGHSLGGGLAAYFATQYEPVKGEDNPFSNFVIVDNGYVDYYNRHFADLEEAMTANEGKTHCEVNVYRIWGGAVNPPANEEQFGLYEQIAEKNWEGINSYFYLPEGANHSDTQTIGLDNGLNLILGKKIGLTQSL